MGCLFHTLRAEVVRYGSWCWRNSAVLPGCCARGPPRPAGNDCCCKYMGRSVTGTGGGGRGAPLAVVCAFLGAMTVAPVPAVPPAAEEGGEAAICP
eukprot:1160202-Pelagomonas_calceolata.AAC.2